MDVVDLDNWTMLNICKPRTKGTRLRTDYLCAVLCLLGGFVLPNWYSSGKLTMLDHYALTVRHKRLSLSAAADLEID